MKILLTGGTGFVGSSLAQKLQQNGHEVAILSRKNEVVNGIPHYYWNAKTEELNLESLDGINGIIHLAGASISEKWTEKYKQELYDSRIQTAHLLYKKCLENGIKLSFFIAASGVNYYGTTTSTTIFSEEFTAGNDFLAQLCVDWEQASLQFREIAQHVCILRTSVVLGKQGMLQKVLPIYRNNLGAALGSGKQWFPWIGIEDLVTMYVFCAENSIDGIYNAASNHAVTQEEFSKTLAKVLHKFHVPISIPSFVLKAIFGEMAEILLKGSRISSEKIQKVGFQFQDDNLERCLKRILHK